MRYFESLRKCGPSQGFIDENIRTSLYEFGYDIGSNEMKRDFYLKNRLSSAERKNLVDVLGVLEKSSKVKNGMDSFDFCLAVLGVGTTVYSDKYFESIKESFEKNNIDIDGNITEIAESRSFDPYGRSLLMDFKTYSEYLEFTEKRIKGSHLEGGLNLWSEENFIKIREKEQIPYHKIKKIKKILSNEGEDIDVAVCVEDDESSGPEKSIGEVIYNFERNLNKTEYDFKREKSSLWFANYRIEDGVAIREKNIVISDTIRIISSYGRDLHFYFYGDDADKKIKRERIMGFPFTQLVRHGNYKELSDTIEYGEESGVFENPDLLQWLKDGGEDIRVDMYGNKIDDIEF